MYSKQTPGGLAGREGSKEKNFQEIPSQTVLPPSSHLLSASPALPASTMTCYLISSPCPGSVLEPLCLYSLPCNLLHFPGLNDPLSAATTIHNPSPGPPKMPGSHIQLRVASPPACAKGCHTLTVSTAVLLICPTTCSSYSLPHYSLPHPILFNSNSIPSGAQVRTGDSSVTPRGKNCAPPTTSPQHVHTLSPPPLHHLQ